MGDKGQKDKDKQNKQAKKAKNKKNKKKPQNKIRNQRLKVNSLNQNDNIAPKMSPHRALGSVNEVNISVSVNVNGNAHIPNNNNNNSVRPPSMGVRTRGDCNRCRALQGTCSQHADSSLGR